MTPSSAAAPDTCTLEPVFHVACEVRDEAAASGDAMGFKAYNLWRMAEIGLPVPPAFVLGTGFCREYFRRGRALPAGFRDLLAANVRHLEKASGLAFGGARKPLLVSVRSGAAVSMPGMMDTVLNIGINDAVVKGLVRLTGNPRLVWDSYRRLVQDFAATVYRAPAAPFAQRLEEAFARSGVERAQELDFQSLEALARDYLAIFKRATGHRFPQNVMNQLELAAKAVLESWQGAKAADYRRLNGIDDASGTAVTVQRMVYGNAGGTSGAGVAFTRDPATGEKTLYMDFLFNAQGEDVVSGRHGLESPALLPELMPKVYDEVRKTAHLLEREFHDAQEFEFTVQDGRLFLLQTRTAKRTPLAALRIAVEQVEEGLLLPRAALERLGGIDLEAIEEVKLAATEEARLLCRAVPASVGVAGGAIALDPAAAERFAAHGQAAILVRDDIATGDIAGIAAASGVLTALGGRTSHAAVVARQLNKVCLVGCAQLTVDLAARRCMLGDAWLAEGDTLCLDANGGAVYSGMPRVVVGKPEAYLRQVASWRGAPVAGPPRTLAAAG